MKIIKLPKTLPSSCCLITKLCLTLCDPVYCSTSGFTVLHYLLEFAKTQFHWGSDAIQPSHPLLPFFLLPSIFSATSSFPVGLLFASVQSLGCIWLFATPWTATRQASLSSTNSQSLLKLMPIESWCHPSISSSVIPFSCLRSFPASGSFLMSQFFASDSQRLLVLQHQSFQWIFRTDLL